MKNILITGVNSYIGNKFEEWVSQWPNQYNVSKISLRNDDWKVMDWSIYDVVLHVAGIAHNSSDPKLEELYYSVNRDLTIEVAEKAKNDGLSHFIFMSSIIVYGTKIECITESTKPIPDNFYGESKLQGEIGIERLHDELFKVTIVRPPMVYGKESKGNYPLLSKLAQITPIFPNYPNKRSMIFVENLSNLLIYIIEVEKTGIICPQNKEFVATSNMVRIIGEVTNTKIWFTKLFNPIITALKSISVVKKIFGNLYYSEELGNNIQYDYNIVDFKKSIELTEKSKEN